jgi:hydrogenase maturation protease
MRVLILGVGNILLCDEGLGVAAVRRLRDSREWPENIRLADGGTLGMRLMPDIQDCDFLLVLDAVEGNAPPGSVYRLTGEELRKSIGFRDSMHQTDLVDTLICCELNGKLPETVVIGMQPADRHSPRVELTPEIAGRIPELCDVALQELRRRGVEFPGH